MSFIKFIMMNDLSDRKVAEIVSENIKTAHVFKKHGIDFCCGGGISVQAACEKNSADMTEVLKDLEQVDKSVERNQDYNNWSLDFLIDHIINIHHTYVLQSLPIMEEYANKVASVHGHHYTFLLEMRNIVNDVVAELHAHLQKEEKILFPYVKAMVQAKNSNSRLPEVHFGSAVGPITVMEMEHDNAGSAFKELRRLSNNYTLPEDACNTFRALYSLLEEFEGDLHQHVHLENNILFPKSKELEEDLNKTS